MLSQEQIGIISEMVLSEIQLKKRKFQLRLLNSQSLALIDENKQLLKKLTEIGFLKNVLQRLCKNDVQKKKTFFVAIVNYLSNHKLVDLMQIDLSYYGIRDTIFISLEKQNWFNLKKLFLSLNLLTSKSIQHLVSLNLPMVQLLYLTQNNLDEKSCGFIASANWVKLQDLCLECNNLKCEGVELLFQGNWLFLKRFDVFQTQVKKSNLNSLSKCNWRQLNQLNLSYNSITRKGVKQIVKANFRNLKHINLQNCLIDDEGMVELSKGNWTKLQTMQLNRNKISNRGIKKFSAFIQFKCMLFFLFELEADSNTVIAFRYLSKVTWNFTKIRCDILLKTFERDQRLLELAQSDLLKIQNEKIQMKIERY